MENSVSAQEDFWVGDFGDSYIKRNEGHESIPSRLSLFSQLLNSTGVVQSVMEFGANVGLNLKALRQLLPEAELSGLEINEKAAEELKKNCDKSYQGSIYNFDIDYKRQLVFSCGVLIHLNPDLLTVAYDKIYSASSMYIFLAEYYSPIPVEVKYRNYSERLFKRDFAGEILERFPDLSLMNYGFRYHRDPCFPLDDINWFLLKKNGSS